MHELSIAAEMIEVISEHLADYPGSRVESVKMALGEYSGVDPEALRMVFPAAAEGTSAEGSELVIRIIPAVVECRECGEKSEETGLLLCMKCGSRNLEFVSGRELEILSFEIAQDD